MIFSVIVTYNPDWVVVAQLVNTLLTQVNGVVIVDNGSANIAQKPDLPIVREVLLGKNCGIAAAQNIGIQAAESLNAKYIIFFDQDSHVPLGFVAALYKEYKRLCASGLRIAAVVPVFKDSRYGFYYPFVNIDALGRRSKVDPSNFTQPFPVSLAISSGTFTGVDAIHVLGNMREVFFIDYVDTEWCLRATHNEYVIYAVPSAVMEHAIGDEFIKFLGFNLPVHSPFRRYYRIRNSFYLLRFPWIPKLLSIREILVSIAHQVILIIKMPESGLHMRALYAGIRDGLRGSGIK